MTSRDCFIERSSELYVAPVKFGGRGNRGYGNILLFIYHMTSRDHIIKELRNFFYSKPLFIFYRFFRSRDIYILLCFSLTTYDHMIKGSCDILCSSPLSLVQSCLVWWLLGRKIYWFLFVTWPHVTTWPTNHATFYVVPPCYKPPLCQVWWPWASWRWRDIAFHLPCDFMWPCDQRVRYLQWWWSLNYNHCLPVFVVVNLAELEIDIL